MIQTLLNPNHVLTDCDNIENIDAQRMAAVLGKHLYGFKKGDERAVVKTLGLDANDDVCWSNTGVPGGGLPPSTPEDEGKVLVVGEDGQPEWADLPSGDIAYSVDRATQASWDVDTLYASTQFYIADSGDNGGIDYYLDGQDRKAGYELLEGHVYQVNFNCEATCASTSNNVWEGSIYITGAQDQNWYFQLDGSQSIDVSLTGSTIIHCSSDGVLYFNARLNGSYIGPLPTLTLNKVSIVDLPSAIGGSGGGGDVPQYRPGPGIEIDDDVISIDPAETQEKLTAGANIDITDNVISTDKTVVAAGSNVTVTSSTDSETKVTTYTVSASGSGVQPVQSNWTESDSQSLAYIQNKPQNLVQDADYTHTDNNFSDADKTKLDNIEAGAEANVQSNWAETDSDSDAYIQNKPTLAAVATSGSYNDLSDQPTIPSGTQLLPPATPADEDKVLTVDSNGYPDWVTPSSPQQVQSNWTEADTSSPAYIANKPTIPSGDQLVPSATSTDEGKILTVDSNGDPSWAPAQTYSQVQTNWNETDTSSVRYIQNKPSIPTKTSDLNNDSNFITASDVPAAQVQSDWAETNTSAASYIANKPNLASVATSGSYSDLSGTPTIPSGNQLLPSATSADENKVLTVDANGDPEWATAQPVSQVQSDWTESDSADVSYIQHKPTVKNLIAGTGISITETAQGIVISLA